MRAGACPTQLQGRFEMIVLHLALVLAPAQPGGRERAGAWRGALSEAFMVDMDDNMREMTFGDLAVPREIKRAAAALFDRHAAYLAALARPTERWRGRSRRNWPILCRRADWTRRGLQITCRDAPVRLTRQPAAHVLGGTDGVGRARA